MEKDECLYLNTSLQHDKLQLRIDPVILLLYPKAVEGPTKFNYLFHFISFYLFIRFTNKTESLRVLFILVYVKFLGNESFNDVPPKSGTKV